MKQGGSVQRAAQVRAVQVRGPRLSTGPPAPHEHQQLSPQRWEEGGREVPASRTCHPDPRSTFLEPLEPRPGKTGRILNPMKTQV